MSWLFKSVMKRHDLTTNPIAVTKTSKASKKEHNYHKPEDIRRMLRVQNAKSVVEWRMNKWVERKRLQGDLIRRETPASH